MKVKKMSRKSFNTLGVKKSKIIKKKKDLSKVTTKEFFEQDFETDTDSDDKNIDKSSEQLNNSDNDSNSNLVEYKRSLIQDSNSDLLYLKKDENSDLNSSDKNDDYSLMDSDHSENLQVPNEDNDSRSKKVDNKCEKITLQLLKTWQQEIQIDKSFVIIKHAIEAFHAAVNSITIVSNTTTRYKVDGNAVFNGIIELCIMHLPNAFKRLSIVHLSDTLDPKSQAIHNTKIEKIMEILKLYISDLITLLQNIALSNNAALKVLLKHLYQMLFYNRLFLSSNRLLLQMLLNLWSTAKEDVRILAFRNILRIITNKPLLLEELLESMYEKYSQNTKVVSFKTLPEINFMKHSLVEIYLLDHNISYSRAFLYVRQLAINLKNAITLKNKENFQAVYNWQYINSLRFWTELIIKAGNELMLESLLYPLVQIIIGTIKLNPTVQYYPLRFHCLELLITISRETGMFIPILPFLLEILDSYDFNKRHKTVAIKPISLVCILRVSKLQLVEDGFKDSIIETIYKLILEHAASESHKIYFPDLYTSCILQLKEFLKNCHVTIYCKKVKQLLSLIEENRKYIETERAKGVIALQDMEKIINWENRIKTDGTAIASFYASYVKRESQNLQLHMKNEEKNIGKKSTKKLNKQ